MKMTIGGKEIIGSETFKMTPPLIDAESVLEITAIYDPPQSLTRMAIGEQRVVRFYQDDGSYYEGTVRKISEDGQDEHFEAVGDLTLKG